MKSKVLLSYWYVCNFVYRIHACYVFLCIVKLSLWMTAVYSPSRPQSNMHFRLHFTLSYIFLLWYTHRQPFRWIWTESLHFSETWAELVGKESSGLEKCLESEHWATCFPALETLSIKDKLSRRWKSAWTLVSIHTVKCVQMSQGSQLILFSLEYVRGKVSQPRGK